MSNVLPLSCMPLTGKPFTIIFEDDEKEYRAIYEAGLRKKKTDDRSYEQHEAVLIWLTDDQQTPLSKIDKQVKGIKL